MAHQTIGLPAVVTGAVATSIWALVARVSDSWAFVR
jgi:hypothetical protein